MNPIVPHTVVSFPQRPAPAAASNTQQELLGHMSDLQILRLAQPSAFRRVLDLARDLSDFHRAQIAAELRPAITAGANALE